MCICASDRVKKERCILRRASKWSDLIERRCKGDDAVTRDTTVGWLHADDAGKACRLTNGAASIGTDGERRVERCDRC